MRFPCPVLFLYCFCLFIPLQGASSSGNSKHLEDSSDILYEKAGELINKQELSDAKRLYTICLRIREKIYNQNHVQLARVHSYLGYIDILELDYDSAIYHYSKSEHIYRYNKLYNRLGNIYNSLGLAYEEKGDYQKALEYYNICLENYNKYKPSNSPEYYYLYISMAYINLKLKNIENARLFFNKTLEISKKYFNEYVPFVYNKLCFLSITEKDYEKAIEYAKLGIQNILSENQDNLEDLTLLYNNIGYAYLELGEVQKSAEYLFKSLSLNKKLYGKYDYRNTYTYNTLGELYEKKGKLKEALHKYQKSINCLSYTDNISYKYNPQPDEFYDKVEACKAIELKMNVLLLLFKKYHDFNYIEAALNTSKLFIEVLETMRNSFQTHESKLFLAEKGNSVYIKATHLAYEAWKFTGDEMYLKQAFSFIEKGKSSILLSAIRNSEAKVSGQLPADVILKETEYNRQIAYYKDLIYEEKQLEKPNREKLSNWENKLFYLKRDMEKFIQDIEKKHPDYFDLKYNTGVISTEQLQSYLDHNTTVIEYVYTDSLIYAFIIDKSKYQLLELPIDNAFNSALNNYLTAFQQFDILGQSTDDKTFFDASYILYEKLIKPVEKYIKNSELIIIPDNKLAYLPFEALLSVKPELPVTNYKNLDYLIRKYTISYSYSSTLLLEKRIKSKRRNEILAFAPNYKLSEKKQNNLSLLDKLRISLPELKGTYEEVNYLKKKYNAFVFKGDSATENAFDIYSPTYNILHLAMHTIIDDENPMFSKLVFAHPQNDKTDGYINTHELYNMKFNARLTVLSSCSTGEGKINKGEGVMNLSRGFLYAGCPSLVITLWKVNDKSGTELMKYFYEELEQGKKQSVAMRNAKLRYLQNTRPETSHPFFWATYVSIGNTEPVYQQKTLRYLMFLVPIILIGIGIIFRKKFLL